MKRAAPLLGCLLLLAAAAVAQEFKRTATSGFVFLELPATARDAALGESSAALADAGADGVFTNPGALGFLRATHAVSVSYAPWFAEMHHYAASYAWNSPAGVFAAGAVALDFGTMQRTVRAQGQRVYDVLGEFSASAVAVGLTYARRLTESFGFGVGLKYAREGIDAYAADNLLLDGGVLYHTGLGSLRLAAVVQNFGTDAKYRNDPFRMPILLRLALAGEIVGDDASDLRLTATAEALHPSDADERVNVGVEAAWRNTIVLRGGYKFFYDEESYSVGVGLAARAPAPAGLDVAFADYGRLGNVLRFTLHVGLD